jgi:hypothetical protein
MPFFKPHPCCSIYFLPTAAKSKQKVPPATKVLNRTKRLILGSFQMCPSNFHSNGILAICPPNKPFCAETLNAGKVVAEPP